MTAGKLDADDTGTTIASGDVLRRLLTVPCRIRWSHGTGFLDLELDRYAAKREVSYARSNLRVILQFRADRQILTAPVGNSRLERLFRPSASAAAGHSETVTATLKS